MKFLRSTFFLLAVFFLGTLSCDEEEAPDPGNLEGVNSKIGFSIEPDSISYRQAMLTLSFSNVINQTILDAGVVWDTVAEPTIEANSLSTGKNLNAVEAKVEGLLPSVQYYIRAYIKLSEEVIAYSDESVFTTKEGELPLITSAQIDTVQVTAIEWSGKLAYGPGELEVTDRGVCWSTETNPTLEDQFESDSSGVGDFKVTLSGLDTLTSYYMRPYATNRRGTIYGAEIEVRTKGLSLLNTLNVTGAIGGNAESGGNITDNGGYLITARGVAWSTSQNPTTADNSTTDGTGTGEFTSELTGLEVSTTYYVRAYATNAVGTSYGEELSFTTTDGMPVVTTSAITDISESSATVGGEVIRDGGFPVTARGIVWGTNPGLTTADNSTTNATGTGAFTSELTGLQVSTTYYVRAYATNEQGTSYGEEQSFTTTDGLPTVTTSAITDISGSSATGGGEVIGDGGFPVTARGIVWGTNPVPTTADNSTTDGTGTGAFTSSLTGLQVSTTYYVRAYATNAAGTSYGEELSFATTDGLPTVTTSVITDISASSATGGGEVISDGGFPITARGIVWSTSPGPTTADNSTSNGTGTGAFTSSLTGLQVSTTYYVRAYATNAVGTSYWEELSFTTTDGLPTVTTSAITDISGSSATGGGEVISDGGFPVTARGVVWSTGQNPTIADNSTIDGTGMGAFTSILTGLEVNTTYYVRAFATNEQGTSYGNEESFETFPLALEFITGGSFDMGCTSEQSNCDDDESPVHTVTVSSFSMSTYKVTHLQYINFLNHIGANADGSFNDASYGDVEYVDMDASNCALGHDGKEFYFKGSSTANTENTPMIEVTWYGANAFAKYVGGRLPTEAEWEYAARGGAQATATLYAGSNSLDEVGWYDSNSGSQTHAVGAKAPNELGLYDMSGNVWEWCEDFFGSYSSGNLTDPTGPDSGSIRVIRGGSWGSAANYCRVAYRSTDEPWYSSASIGFRVVLP